MSLETVLYTRLTTFSGLAALVGLRVYARNAMPQGGMLPAVSFYRVSVERVSAMGVDTGLARARVQVDTWDTTVDGARAVAEQVRLALQRWRNNTGTVVQDVYVLNELDLYEEETRLHRVMYDFDVVFVEG
jgi:hypothetical protein